MEIIDKWLIFVAVKLLVLMPKHKKVTHRRLTALLLMLSIFVLVEAQDASTIQPGGVALRTNMLYDVVVAPNIGLEARIADKWSVAASGVYGWMDGSPWYDNIRVVAGDAELRYWLTGNAMRQGLHIGAYGAVYRYDFLFGNKGEEAKANWGTGLSCGYAVSLDRHFSIDFSIGIGYVGGRYQSYEVTDDAYHHNVWTADKIRHYIGPTKAEISLVWHIFGLSSQQKKGGSL